MHLDEPKVCFYSNSHNFRLNENGRRKCEQYWPDEKGGEITDNAATTRVMVTKLEENKNGPVICRHLSILPQGKSEVSI